MKSVFSKDLTVLTSACDDRGILSVPAVFALFMDAATEHADRLGVGFPVLAARDLFWLTVKTRIRFFRRPAMMEHVTVTTWPEAPGKLRCDRDYRLTAGEEILAEGKTEWAVWEVKTGRLHPAADVFPPDLVSDRPPVWDDPFARIDEDFSRAEDLGEYTVRSTDVDLGGHMNNAAYVRALAGAFSCKAWNALQIREMDVVFRHPCFEGERLGIRMRRTDAETDLAMVRCDGAIALLARIR